ncbi:MAG: hypothetical protein DWQ39_02685 [Bacteroidetes bacterium]|nr:MAG: hypothetical protein DWQ39_02685 [Bacteroidota bacterium]
MISLKVLQFINLLMALIFRSILLRVYMVLNSSYCMALSIFTFREWSFQQLRSKGKTSILDMMLTAFQNLFFMILDF